nr:RNA-directed DNA polymerase, eukaryota, reverse transcriptase zinc-binding domain protein [Tanacetum cinerariifolium]
MPDKIRVYVSFVYASNNGTERRELWNSFLMDKRVVVLRAHGVFLPYLVFDHSCALLIFPDGLPKKLGVIVKLKLSMEDAEAITVEVCDKEIKEAIFDIDFSKASGPDGYTSYFFKKTWDHIGKDVCLVVREFFISGKLLGEVNATLIALVPKINKCIIKILTNKIKDGLNKVVSIN